VRGETDKVVVDSLRRQSGVVDRHASRILHRVVATTVRPVATRRAARLPPAMLMVFFVSIITALLSLGRARRRGRGGDVAASPTVAAR
jgi:hypothetical protein